MPRKVRANPLSRLVFEKRYVAFGERSVYFFVLFCFWDGMENFSYVLMFWRSEFDIF